MNITRDMHKQHEEKNDRSSLNKESMKSSSASLTKESVKGSSD